MKKSLLIILIITLLNGTTFAAKSEAEKIWEIADKAYKDKRYKDAIFYYEKSLSLCNQDLECLAANYNGLGSSYEDLGELNKALYYYEKAIEINKRWGNKEWLADNLLLAGRIYYNLGEYQKAFSYLSESKNIFYEFDAKDSLAIVLHEYGKILRALGRYKDAITSFNDSIKYYKLKEDEQSIGANLSQIGLTYTMMGQPETALKYLEDALKIARKFNDKEAISITLRELADANYDLFRIDKAISLYEEALKIQKDNNLTKEYATTLNNLGILYLNSDRYEKAIQLFDEALKIALDMNDKPTIASLYNNLGQANTRLGKTELALNYYNKSLEIENKLNRPQFLSDLLNNIGMSLFRQNNFDEAIKYLQQALELDKKSNNPHYIAAKLNNLGAAYLKQKRYREAEKIFLERKALEDKIKPNRMIHSGLVEVYLQTGRYEEALNLLSKTPPIWSDSTSRRIEYYTQLGFALKGKNNYQEAAINFMNAVNLIEEIRGNISSKELFFSYGGYYSRLTPYKALVETLYEMYRRGEKLKAGGQSRFDFSGFNDRTHTRRSAFNFLTFGGNPASAAFYFSELTKARFLLESIAQSKKNYNKADIPDKLKEAETHLFSELKIVEDSWETAIKKGEQSIKELQTRKDKIMKLIDELIVVLRSNYPKYASLHYPLPTKPEDLQLKNDEALLEYMISDEAIYLFIVKKGGVSNIHKIEISKNKLEQLVRDLLEPMNTKRPNDFSTKNAKKLYDILLSDYLSTVKENEKLIIIPDGILGALPFEILVVKEGNTLQNSVYLFDKYSISYYQSASILNINRTLQKRTPQEKLFALGNPIYSPRDPRYLAFKHGENPQEPLNVEKLSFRGLVIKEKLTNENIKHDTYIEFPPLPETEDEVKTIAAIMGIKPQPPNILLSLNASETNLKKTDLGRYRYIHFATHAALPGVIEGIGEPFILLNQVGNSEDDGFLTLSEVLGFKLNADLVVLSACVTGLGKYIDGEGVLNFSRAFLQSGAESVLVSLWEVASKPTVEFMKIFYENLQKGINKSDALKLTRITMKETYNSPFYWGVFVLHGESR